MPGIALLGLKKVLANTVRAPCKIRVSLIVSSISEMMEMPVGSTKLTIPVLGGNARPG